MKSKIVVSGVLLFLLTASFAQATGELVSFKGASKSGDQFILKGILTKPKDQGPFPAVVILHGASGIEGNRKYLDIWAKRFADWGYVSLQVDSFGPRGESDISANPVVIDARKRGQDAHDAKTFLAERPFVNPNQIAIMGWSHGGWAVLYAIDSTLPFQNRGHPFRCAIAFYPHCDVPLRGLNAPLLILAGELDDWLPPERCKQRMPSGQPTLETTLKVYPGAYHGFDLENIDETKQGHRILYDPAATKDAVDQVKNFLAKYLQ
jgi:dienelactone hydrolase